MGSPYLDVLSAGASPAPGQSIMVRLMFSDPDFLSISYTPRLLAGAGER